MATITTELVDTGAKRDERGRRFVTTTERAALILAYQRSGLTQRVFAQREGIKYSTFTAWLQGRRRAEATQGKNVRFAEVAMAESTTGGGITMELPDGVVIRGCSAREVAELVLALRG